MKSPSFFYRFYALSNWFVCHMLKNEMYKSMWTLNFGAGMEIGERLAFYGISANLVTYLTRVLHEGTAPSAKNVNNWIGATFIAPLLGAFLADAYWGRFWTILIFGFVYFVVSELIYFTLYSFQLSPCCKSNRLHNFTVLVKQ